MTKYVLEKTLFTNLLTKFLPATHHSKFNEILKEARAIVAGAWSLYLIESCQSQEDFLKNKPSPSWFPKDMDIWINIENWPILDGWFHRNGYQSKICKTDDILYYDENLLRELETYNIEGSSIRINVLYHEPFDIRERVLKSFYLSVNQNFWDGSTLATFHIENIKEKKMFSTRKSKPECPIDTYQDRGYEYIEDESNNESILEIEIILIIDVCKRNLQAMQNVLNQIMNEPLPDILELLKSIRNYKQALLLDISDNNKELANMEESIQHLKAIKSYTHKGEVLKLIENTTRSILSLSRVNAENINFYHFIKTDAQNANEDYKTCPVCLDNVKNTVFEDCGHTCCSSCAARLEQCFVCRKKITNSIHFYL